MSSRADTRTKIIVFARAPRAGRVKTRLIPLLGEQGAARLHARLLRRALATARRRGSGRWSCGRPGAGAGSGSGRTHAARIRASLRRSDRVISSAPMPGAAPRRPAQAARWLAGGADAVFAPAQDGGYALVARRGVARLFGPGVGRRAGDGADACPANHARLALARTARSVGRGPAGGLPAARARRTASVVPPRARPSGGSRARSDGCGRT